MTTSNDFLNINDIEISISCEQDWANPHNCLKECMDRWEIDSLWNESKDNPWKWGEVKVTASYIDPQGRVFKNEVYLSGCSYDSKADFIQANDYYEDMVNEAVEGLVKSLR